MKRNHQRPSSPDYSGDNSSSSLSSSSRQILGRNSIIPGSWRFLVYLLIIFLLWQFLSTFQHTPQGPIPPSNISPLEPDTAEIPLEKNDKLAQYQKKRNTFSPPPPRITDKKRVFIPYEQVDLGVIPAGEVESTQERQERERLAVSKARQEALTLIGNYSGIAGTKISTDAQARKVREIINCWTSSPDATWLYDPRPRSLLNHFQDSLFSKCDRRYAKNQNIFDMNKPIPMNDKGDWLVPEHTKYVWKPSPQCPRLKPIDRDAWCRYFRGRNILIIGDSLNYQIHDLFLDIFREGPTVCYGELNCREHIMCGPPTTPKNILVRFIRNDLLLPNRKMEDVIAGKADMNVVRVPWYRPQFLQQFTVILLNRGSSYVPDDEFRQQLIELLKNLRENYPETLVIYRNTPIGHLNCSDATGPLTRQPTEEELQTLPFHWSEFKRQNLIAKEIVEAAGGLYFDVASMTNLRPDGHIGGRDCLRYCIPGVTTEWMRVLYNAFRLLEGNENLEEI